MLAIFKKIFNFSQKRKKTLQHSIIFNIIYSIFSILQFVALYVAVYSLFNDSIQHAGRITLILMLVSIAGRTIMDCNSNLLQTEAGYYMVADKRISIGDRMKYMPMGFFNKNSLGRLTAILTTLCSDVEHNAPKVLNTVISGFVYTLVLSVAVLLFNWQIGLIFVAGIIVFLIIYSSMQKTAVKLGVRRKESQSRLVEASLEYIQGLSVIRAFNINTHEHSNVNDAIEADKELNLEIEKKILPYVSLAELILRVAMVGVMALTIWMYLNGTIEIWDGIILLIVSFYMYAQLEQAGTMTTILRIMDSSINEINEVDSIDLMDTNGKEIKPKNHDIEFKNVSFSYNDQKVLKNINLRIPEKKTTALVGHSGSGKTTLCNLIARFWDVDNGSITLGGVDIRNFKQDSLLNNISYVFQNVYLFNDTIENNIKFGRPEATRNEVIAAAKKACCDEFISRLPNGYDTVIGEEGATISGGERQRISIARAILKDAPVIILDEATSNVDPENEVDIQRAIEELTRDKTIIMIAHRIKTVEHADQIVVLERGEIVEQGKHAELINNKGIYSKFISLREKAGNWTLA